MDWTGYERSGYGLEETAYDLLEEEEDIGEEEEEEENEEDQAQNQQQYEEDTSLEYAKPSYSVYKRKYQLLVERMAAMNQENEIIVYRINKIKKLVAAGNEERRFLMSELDKRGDSYRGIPVNANPYQDTDNKKKESVAGERKNRKIKTEKEKKESRDPNLPKRPQNPFFQYCKEQRECVTREEFEKDGTQLSKKELTKLLAQKWNILNSEEKQVYTDRFEEERAGYNIRMETYRKQKEEETVSGAQFTGLLTPIKAEQTDE